jgi:hypothetical protein
VRVAKYRGKPEAWKELHAPVIIRVTPADPGTGKHDASCGDSEERLPCPLQAPKESYHSLLAEHPHPLFHVASRDKNEIGLAKHLPRFWGISTLAAKRSKNHLACSCLFQKSPDHKAEGGVVP